MFDEDGVSAAPKSHMCTSQERSFLLLILEWRSTCDNERCDRPWTCTSRIIQRSHEGWMQNIKVSMGKLEWIGEDAMYAYHWSGEWHRRLWWRTRVADIYEYKTAISTITLSQHVWKGHSKPPRNSLFPFLQLRLPKCTSGIGKERAVA